MDIVRGRDGMYCASDVGAMGRPMAAFSETWLGAVFNLEKLSYAQEDESYAHEAAMSHLSISQEPEGSKYQ
jgi:hypothetical protein